MITANKILSLLIIHWIADFVCQTDWMAQNKSKRIIPLLAHVGVYTSILLIFTLLYPIAKTSPEILIRYALWNGAYHFGTDFITSRITSYLWSKNETHWFFVVVGLDQLIHYICLIKTIPYDVVIRL